MIRIAANKIFAPRGPAAPLVALAFVGGVIAGAAIASLTAGAPVAAGPAPARVEPTLSNGLSAEVLRVVDGDTFEARVPVWPGVDITTKVRLRGIDTPELKARCAEEREQAEAAREALRKLLADGDVAILRVAQDKYSGRVIADARARATPDIAAALIAQGHARTYDGGKRLPWCKVAER